MIDPPQIIQTAAQLAATIHLTIPKSEVRRVMGPGLREVMAAVAAQGVAPTGPWFTHHLGTAPDTYDFEIGLPVATPIVAAGRVTPGEWPSTKVARTIYHGGYEGLGAGWGELMAWIAQSGHEPGPDFWEVYLAGPESGLDPAGWLTELSRPLVG